MKSVHYFYSGGSRISRWGGADPLGGADLQCVCFLAKTSAKMKELDPVGGAHRRCPPGAANGLVDYVVNYVTFLCALQLCVGVSLFHICLILLQTWRCAVLNRKLYYKFL